MAQIKTNEERDKFVEERARAIWQEAERRGFRISNERTEDEMASGWVVAAKEWSGSTYFHIESPVWAAKANVIAKVNRCKSSMPGSFSVEVEIGWSSCGRGVASALVAVDLYRKAIEFAAFIEAVCEHS